MGVRRRTDMKMNVAGVGMIDYAPVEKVGALMRSDSRLGMDPAVYTGKIVDTIAQILNHFLQKMLQGYRFLAAFNLLDTAIFYSEADRFFEIG